MSVGPLGGVFGSAAGAPLSQTKGSELERNQRDQSAGQRQTESTKQAEQASGVGQTEEDQESSDRDADGRRLWETPARTDVAPDESSLPEQRSAKDATGHSGNHLDLTG